ncbi:MAG: type II secretion system F family protein [Gammaproteobacteria bacterium]|nr:MAG: type II secretion system F family protein [Gammaproteobacteria bacterium]
MTSFIFKGRDKEGSQVTGEREAGSQNELAGLLMAEGIVPTNIEDKDESSGQSIDWNNLLKGKGKVSLDELIIFCRQMNSLMKAGVPMIQALRGLSSSNRNDMLKEGLEDVSRNLESGLSLAAAMQTRSDIFDNLFMSMIHVGENTGQLDTAFKQLADYLEMERETRKRIKQAVRYPIMVLAAISIAIVLINVMVIPAFAAFFAKFDAELPWQTRVLMATSEFFIEYGWFLIITLGIAFYGFLQYIKTGKGQFQWDRFKLKAPLIGGIFERIALGRFSRTFSMTYRTGVPILQALVVVANASGNAYIAKFVNEMRGQIERGESLTQAASNSGMFTPLVLQMLSVGEETGALDSLMDQVADFYEEEVDYDLKQLSDAIEPILIVVMGAMVLVVALGVFLPMWDLASAMKK